MFASIRRYRLRQGPMQELARRVDEGFAEEISAQPGFASYEFIDCGEGEVITLSIFRDADEAEASRDLAQRWTEASLGDFEFYRIEALRGEILVSRAARDMLEPGHAGTGEKFVFAEQILRMEGFEAYHALDFGRGEIVSISLFRDQATAEESDERALEFIRDELGDFDIERTEVTGGRVTVSRALADLLEPAHA